jgi:hypothetical protein
MAYTEMKTKKEIELERKIQMGKAPRNQMTVSHPLSLLMKVGLSLTKAQSDLTGFNIALPCP